MSEANVARRIALEEEAVNIGQTRYRKDRPMPWSDSKGKFDEASLPPGAAVLRKYTSIVALRVEAGVKLEDGNGRVLVPRYAVRAWAEPEPGAKRYWITCEVIVHKREVLVSIGPVSKGKQNDADDDEG